MPITLSEKGKTEKVPKGKDNNGTSKKRDETMGINVSTSMGFENRDFIREKAKQILQKNGTEEKIADGIAKKMAYYTSANRDAGLSILAASSQITLNSSLKETLRYLNAHANDKRKQYVLGELWDKLGKYQDENTNGELIDFEIDYNSENIFAA